MMKRFTFVVALLLSVLILTGCEYEATRQNTKDTRDVTEALLTKQPTPTDIDFSLERYNLIKRAYWVNGQREKARAVVCEVERPIGYITLICGSTVLTSYTVDGKVSSLNSYLSPDSEEYASSYSAWLADVDGSFGENVDGVFWFDTNGNYHEWTGTYLYSDIPLVVDSPTLNVN